MPLPLTMTVGALRAALRALPDDHPVYLQYPYGDYHRTPALRVLTEVLVTPPIEEGGYSESGWALRPGDEGPGCPDRCTYLPTVVLS